VRATAEDGAVHAPGLRIRYDGSAEGQVLAGVRPHDVTAQSDGPIELRVDVLEAMGFESFAHGRVGETSFVARLEPDHPARPGDTVRLDVAEGALHLFDPQSERAL